MFWSAVYKSSPQQKKYFIWPAAIMLLDCFVLAVKYVIIQFVDNTLSSVVCSKCKVKIFPNGCRIDAVVHWVEICFRHFWKSVHSLRFLLLVFKWIIQQMLNNTAGCFCESVLKRKKMLYYTTLLCEWINHWNYPGIIFTLKARHDWTEECNMISVCTCFVP